MPPIAFNGPAGEAPDLTVSVVTYNSADSLEALLESLSMQDGVRWELFVVDNASTDGTAGMLGQCSMGEVTFNSENLGYGRAHNQNRSRFRGRHLVVLNPDVVLPPGLFAGLVRHLDETPGAAVAGPMVREGAGHVPFPPRRFYPGEGMIPLEADLRRSELAWITGSCMAVRRSVFEAVGGFDPDYFLYFEETDLCLRIRRAGYRIGWAPELEVWHQGQRSQSDVSEYQRNYNLFSGATMFWQKHYAPRDVRCMLRFQSGAAWVILFAGRFFEDWGRRDPRFRAERLRARRDVCRGWLTRHQFGLFPIDFRSWRILARALHLLLAWLRGGGRLDLDDF